MSTLSRFFSSLKSIVPKLAGAFKDAYTSGTLQTAVTSVIGAGKSLFSAFKSGGPPPPLSVADVPQYIGGVVNQLETVMPEVKQATSAVSDVLFAAGKNNYSEALSTFRSKMTTQNGINKARDFEESIVKIAPRMTDSQSASIDQLEAASPSRMITATEKKSAAQHAMLTSLLESSHAILKNIAPGANIGINGIVSTGLKDKWLADLPFNIYTNDGPSCPFGVGFSSIVGNVATYDNFAPKLEPGFVPNADTNPNATFLIANSTPPKSDCYDWFVNFKLGFSYILSNTVATWLGVRVRVYNNGTLISNTPLIDSVYGGAIGTTVIPIRVPLLAQNRIQVYITVGTVLANVIRAGVNPDAVYFEGILKVNHNVCPVTDVTYWDGTQETSVSADATWLDMLGKVARTDNGTLPDHSDPNLELSRLWVERIGNTDLVFQVMSAVDIAMRANLPGVDNHNTFNYAPKTLTDFANVDSWIYSDGPFAGLSIDQKRARFSTLLTHSLQILDLLDANTNVQRALYDAFTNVSS